MSLFAEVWGDGAGGLAGTDEETAGGGAASVAVSVLAGEPTAAISPLIQTMLCKLALSVPRLQRTNTIMIAMWATAMMRDVGVVGATRKIVAIP